MIVQSGGALTAFASPAALTTVPEYPSYAGAWSLTDDAYAVMYARQPSVRTVVDFLARSIADVNIHAYRRVSDTDRVRLADHDVVRWLAHPNDSTVRYRLFESLMLDFLIFWNAYWLKGRLTTGDVSLMRLPAQRVVPLGGLFPVAYRYFAPDGQTFDLAPGDLVHLNGYNPDAYWQLKGVPPLETLRQLLEEDCAASAYRRAYWTNSARLEGVITRPAGAPKWSLEQKQAFREQWQSRFSGAANAGQTAVLEDGMTFTATSFSASDSEYLSSRKLTQEEVTRAYQVPLPMVGLLDHATFSNVKEQHKQLYQDTLSPWFDWIAQELMAQLLVESTDRTDVYLEFNIAEKLQGAFEEQTTALHIAVGRPFMTPNEARARLNLPSIKDDPTADQLAQQQGAPGTGVSNVLEPPTPTAVAAQTPSQLIN